MAQLYQYYFYIYYMHTHVCVCTSQMFPKSRPLESLELERTKLRCWCCVDIAPCARGETFMASLFRAPCDGVGDKLGGKSFG